MAIWFQIACAKGQARWKSVSNGPLHRTRWPSRLRFCFRWGSKRRFCIYFLYAPFGDDVCFISSIVSQELGYVGWFGAVLLIDSPFPRGWTSWKVFFVWLFLIEFLYFSYSTSKLSFIFLCFLNPYDSRCYGVFSMFFTFVSRFIHALRRGPKLIPDMPHGSFFSSISNVNSPKCHPKYYGFSCGTPNDCEPFIYFDRTVTTNYYLLR